jgi:hypothetical protein
MQTPVDVNVEHVVPSGSGGLSQPPGAMHTSLVQGLPSKHVGRPVPGVQTPSLQTSPTVQGSSSKQGLSETGTMSQSPVRSLQTPA